MGPRPALVQSRQEKNSETAARLRDNKRRHRARQKEYVLDLERRVTEAREQGVQATKEVQLAAQRVVRENAGLRDLLRRSGYTDNAIDVWLREHGYLHGGERPQVTLESMPGMNSNKMPSTCEARTGQTLEAQNACVKEREPGQKETPDRGAHLTTTPPRSTESHSEKPDAVPTKACTGTCTKASSLPGNPDSTTAPCKLLTLLEKDPTADITQVPLPTQTDKQPCKTSNPEDCSSDGVECATAYKMLMQYATSDEKMGRIAAALESGCTPSAAGGCKVKKSVVWSVLDEECT